MTRIFSTHNHPSWLKSWPKSNLALSTMRKLFNNRNIKTQNATRQKHKLRHDLSPTSPGHLQEASYQQTGTNSVNSSQYFSESHTCGMSHICLMVEAQFLFVKVIFHGVQYVGKRKFRSVGFTWDSVDSLLCLRKCSNALAIQRFSERWIQKHPQELVDNNDMGGSTEDYLKRFLTFSCLTFAGACVVSSSGTFEEVKNKKSLHHHHHHHHDHHHDVMTSCSLQWTLWSSPGQQCLLHHPELQPRSWKPWSDQSGSLLCDELQPFSEIFFLFCNIWL